MPCLLSGDYVLMLSALFLYLTVLQDIVFSRFRNSSVFYEYTRKTKENTFAEETDNLNNTGNVIIIIVTNLFVCPIAGHGSPVRRGFRLETSPVFRGL